MRAVCLAQTLNGCNITMWEMGGGCRMRERPPGSDKVLQMATQTWEQRQWEIAGQAA